MGRLLRVRQRENAGPRSNGLTRHRLAQQTNTKGEEMPLTETKKRTYRKADCAFFMRSRDRWGKLSNMTFGFPLEVNGMRFQGPEGLYQALKFPHDPGHQALIASQRSGMEAKKVAYRNPNVRPDWDNVRVEAMAHTLTVKLLQHPDFGKELLSTKKLPIVEMSRRDDFWGAKPNSGETALEGTNTLGQLLTLLRDELRKQQGLVRKTISNYLANVRTDRLVINGKPVS